MVLLNVTAHDFDVLEDWTQTQYHLNLQASGNICSWCTCRQKNRNFGVYFLGNKNDQTL